MWNYITEDEFICALKNMPKIKWPGNNDLTKELYKTLCDRLKRRLVTILRTSFLKGELSNS